MNFNNLKQNISKILNPLTGGKIKFSPDTVNSLMVWTLPSIVVPFGRRVFDRDKPPEIANEIFLRDLTTYTIGSIAFLAPWVAASKFLNKTNIKPLKNMGSGQKKVVSTAVGLAANLLWCVTGSCLSAKELNKKNYVEKPGIYNSGKPALNRRSELAFTQTFKNFHSGYKFGKIGMNKYSKVNLFNIN